MSARPLAAALLLLALLGRPAGAEEGALAREGRRWWTESPDPRNPVACATCHFDPAAVRGWAAAFPRFRPLPPPAARVMTLLQATAEAVERHYRVPDPLPAAIAITAYLAALGADLPVTPGTSAEQPVFPARMAALALSVGRGGEVFAERCAACHRAAEVARAARGFPRLRDGRGEALETFLASHDPRQALGWDGGPMADLTAYLVSHLTGQPLAARPANPPSKEAR